LKFVNAARSIGGKTQCGQKRKGENQLASRHSSILV
jgi:hypothetical protein